MKNTAIALAVAAVMSLSAAAQAQTALNPPPLEPGQCRVEQTVVKTLPLTTRTRLVCGTIFGSDTVADIGVDSLGFLQLYELQVRGIQDCRDPLRSDGPSSPPTGSYQSAGPSQSPC